MSASPVVSRAAAQAYEFFPDLRDALPTQEVERMQELGELLEALADIDETYPGRLVAEGSPLTWAGVNEVVGKAGRPPGALPVT